MRIAIAGLGNVGAAVVRLLDVNRDNTEGRAPPLTITAVSARDSGKPRACGLAGIAWAENPRALAARADVDIVVETIGGADGAAYDLARAALESGKHFVTANKMLIAAHGVELATVAERNKLQLSFEAAVCGGIPIVKALREGLAANRILSLRGIVNGTCNYILTRMAEEGVDCAAALAEAQAKGYAEADPAADIDGHDSACKLAILSALAFGIAPDTAAVAVEGIGRVTPDDLRQAEARGGRIKLLAEARRTGHGVAQRVAPLFVPFEEPLARVGGTGNMIEITGDCAGVTRFGGIGAGGNATASAVVADLIDIARGNRCPAFGMPADRLQKKPTG